MWYWYNDFYAAVATSKAYAQFCERVFGRNFGQHSFADMPQVAKLLAVTQLGSTSRVLDLGCGNGAMDEYIAETTGAQVTGIDYCPIAIEQAQARKPVHGSLVFVVGDLADLDFPAQSFDALIAIDTLYFTPLESTIDRMQRLLAPEGQMALFYSHGANPETPLAVFRRETLPPDATPLAVALHRYGLAYTWWDFTWADYRHALRKKRMLEELETTFAAEGNTFLFENRYGEANGVIAAVEAGAHARYLYHVTKG